MINKSDKIYIAGHRGMVGSACWRALEAEGYTNLVGKTSKELDLRDQKAVEEEFGDVLFSLVNYARFIGVDPSYALEKTNQKFLHRFRFIEAQAKKENKTVDQLSLEEMETFWQAAKKT